jgi:hypothetical protein
MEKDTLKDDREAFSAASDHESDMRKAAQSDLEFALLEKQWNDADKSKREEEGRPCLTINRLPSFGKQVINDAKMNRATINVKPVGDGADKETADILSDLIRNIETASQAESAYDTALEFAVYGGYGYFRVNVDYAHDDAWDQDISIARINNPFSVYGDPDGKESTSIDWNSAYVTDWYSKAAFETRWGKDKKAGSFEAGSGDYDEKWFNNKKIRVAERWLREEVQAKLLKLTGGTVMYESEYLKEQDDGGTFADILKAQGIVVEGDRITKTHKVKQRLITGTDVLEKNDWLGKYIPIIPMYGEEVNINGKRYFISLIRRAKDPQRMFNYHRTSVAEQLANASRSPWLIAEGQVEDHADKWQQANRVSLPYLTYTHIEGVPPPIRMPYSGVPIGDMQAALADNDDMKAVIGMHDASLGARSNETSGKAIMARQREGDTSTFNFIDNRNKAVEHGGRIVLDLIPHYYTVGRILRCIQEDGSTYTLPVGQPVAPKADLQAIQQQAAAMQPGQPMPEQAPQDQTQGPPEYEPVPEDAAMTLPPELQQKLMAITKIFDPTTGKYDITATAGPSFTTRREEAANQMMEFIRIFPQAAPLIGDLLAKNLDWPGAEQVAERLRAMLPPQAAGQVPPMVQKLQGMLQQQDAQAKQAVGQLRQQIEQLTKQLNDKTQEFALKDKEIGVKAFDAQTKRAEVLKPETVQPQQVDPIKAAELQLKAQELALQAKELELSERDKSVSEYEAQTKRLQLLAERLPPEAFQLLIMKTTGEAMATTLESAEGDPCGAMAGHMAGAMPMAEPMDHMTPDGSMMTGEMGGMENAPMDQRMMPENGMQNTLEQPPSM